MTNRQRANFDSLNRVQDFNTLYDAELILIPEYVAVRGVFNTDVSDIQKALQVQENSGGADYAIVSAIKLEMAETVLRFALKASVKANLLKMYALEKQLTISLTTITQSPKSEAIAIVKDMRDAMFDHLAVLTNLTAADITSMDAAINAYELEKDAPTKERDKKKAYGTKVIPAKIKAGNKNVNLMYRIIVSKYKESNSSRVTEFELAKQINITGVRHNEINFRVLKSENNGVVADAAVLDLSNGKTYFSHDAQPVHIAKHRMGHFHFKIMAPGRETLEFPAEIKPRKLNEFTVHLKIATGTLSGAVVFNNQPAVGATISIEGTQLTAITDALGTYRLPGITFGNRIAKAQLLNSEIFQNQAVVIPGNSDTVLNFTF